jgi:hypothetical protein
MDTPQKDWPDITVLRSLPIARFEVTGSGETSRRHSLLPVIRTRSFSNHPHQKTFQRKIVLRLPSVRMVVPGEVVSPAAGLAQRHQRSPEGQLDHRGRKCAWRRRQRAGLRPRCHPANVGQAFL